MAFQPNALLMLIGMLTPPVLEGIRFELENRVKSTDDLDHLAQQAALLELVRREQERRKAL
jgi:hypothetical protein